MFFFRTTRFNCHEFEHPPVKNEYVQASIDRVEAKQKQEYAKEVKEIRSKQRSTTKKGKKGEGKALGKKEEEKKKSKKKKKN
jgi:hypothetical protein